MRKFSVTLKVIFLTAALSLGMGIAANPAQAATCGTDKICLWTSPNFTGSKIEFTLSSGCYHLGYPYDDNISSWFSNSQKDFRAYLSHSVTGTYFWIEQGWDSSLSGIYNNSASAICYGQ